MKTKFESNLIIASKLLNTPSDYENYISIKLTSFSGCCCSHCWPVTWQAINEFIYPCGPVGHEGEALFIKDKDKYVIKSHESGPEIILYMAGITASATLLKSIIDLITTIIKSLSIESKRQPSKIKFSRRQIVKGEIEEENLIEIEIPISEKTVKQIESKILKSIQR